MWYGRLANLYLVKPMIKICKCKCFAKKYKWNKYSYVLVTNVNQPKPDRDNRPLRVTILPAYLVAHQIHALKLCSWLTELFGKCSGFRALFFQVLCEEDSVIDDEKKSFLVKLLTKSSMTWKAVRRAWTELIVEVALKVSWY